MKCHKCGKESSEGCMRFVVSCAICDEPICDTCGDWPEDGGFRCADHTKEEIIEYDKVTDDGDK